MPSTTRAYGQAHRARQQRQRARRVRRLAGLVVLVSALLVTLSLTAFGSSPTAVRYAQPAPAQRLVPAGPPRPQVVARRNSLRLQLPVPQARVTAIGYHAAGDGALPLTPVGTQRNEGVLSRLFHRVFGGRGGGLRYYLLGGGDGPGTGALDVGAPAGTDVYSPVHGTVVGLTPFVLNGERYGVRIDLEPSDAPSVVVSVTRVRPDPALRVGASVAAGSDKLGAVLDLAHVERQALARYTQDSGNHVSLEVRPAATLR